MISHKAIRSVREKIRTPDLLIRSQTLYPAELSTHERFETAVPYRTLIILTYKIRNVNKFFIFFAEPRKRALKADQESFRDQLVASYTLVAKSS